MNRIIYKRKSVRKYQPQSLDDTAMGQIRELIEGAKPLFPQIPYSVEMVPNTKPGKGSPLSFLAFSSEEQEGFLENIGFVGQQISLGLSAIGLGSCWRMGRPEGQMLSQHPFVISMAFGLPAEDLFREQSQFKRKPLSRISEGQDSRLEAARLAPSGLNAQDWFFMADKGKIYCYRKKPNPLMAKMKNRMNCIDMGIALCHIAQESQDFHYNRETNYPEVGGYIYMGTVE